MISAAKNLPPLIAVLLLSSFIYQQSAGEPAVSVQTEVQMLCNGELRYLELTGTPYERGYTHGRLLKEEIDRLLKLWKEDIHNSTKMEADRFIALFLEETDYRKAIEQHAPELLEELGGIADGSGARFDDLFMFQLVDEYWFNSADLLTSHHCTSLGVDRTLNHPAMTAQNMDIPRFYHGFQMVMKIGDPDSELESLVLTMPGHLGITGMNNRGVSINCNTLIQLRYGRVGLPVTYIVRAVVKQSTREDAVALLKSIRHASGQNYVIGGPERPVSLECSAGKVEEFRPFPDAAFTYHTNHPLVNNDFSQRFLDRLKNSGRSLSEVLSTCRRLPALRNRFNEETVDITIQDIKEALSSRDHVRDPISNSSTFASVIYELGDIPRLHIAAGGPHEKSFFIIEFQNMNEALTAR